MLTNSTFIAELCIPYINLSVPVSVYVTSIFQAHLQRH
jgi:hypothetical protein